MTYRTVKHSYYNIYGVFCDGENPLAGETFSTESAANMVRDALNENAALKARIAELEEELGGWVKSFDDVNARCIALSERYES